MAKDKKHAILVLAHKPTEYIYTLAKQQPEVNFYIHFDKKSQGLPLETKLSNINILDDRVSVYWAGFSQVEATLRLMKYAYQNEENYYFHLISGEDVLLIDFEKMEKEWETIYNNNILIKCYESKRHRYRVRFDTPHADTKWQRSFLGKVLTKLTQLIDFVIPTKMPCLFGSQWFSVQRHHLVYLLNLSEDYVSFFQKKLCPDEHFFQKITNDKCQEAIINDNKRFIIFGRNHPYYLNKKQLLEAQENHFWFARKVEQAVALDFLNHNDG